MILRLPWLAGLFAALVLAPAASFAAIPVYGVSVVRTYPHDRAAFTEGLFYLDGWLYESTGEDVRVVIRKVELATGRVVLSRDIAPRYFGEGIVAWKGRLIELTWQEPDRLRLRPEDLPAAGQLHLPRRGLGAHRMTAAASS